MGKTELLKKKYRISRIFINHTPHCVVIVQICLRRELPSTKVTSLPSSFLHNSCSHSGGLKKVQHAKETFSATLSSFMPQATGRVGVIPKGKVNNVEMDTNDAVRNTKRSEIMCSHFFAGKIFG